jgi:hypothetical protein
MNRARPSLLERRAGGGSGWHGKIQAVQWPDSLAQFWHYYRKIGPQIPGTVGTSAGSVTAFYKKDLIRAGGLL